MGERGREDKWTKPLFLLAVLAIFDECLAKIPSRKVSSHSLNLFSVPVSAQQTEPFVQKQHQLFHFFCDDENIAMVIQKA